MKGQQVRSCQEDGPKTNFGEHRRAATWYLLLGDEESFPALDNCTARNNSGLFSRLDLLSDNITFIMEVSKVEMVTIFLPKVGLVLLLGEVSAFTLLFPSQWLS